MRRNFFVFICLVLLVGYGFPQYVRGVVGHIVINEIKVGGEKATDEFIELYNPTGAEVNLAGWRLSKKTASGSLSNLLTEFPSVTIPSLGVIVIAHDDYTNAAVKDLSYSTQSSITADNTVILYSDNGQTIVDLVGMGSASEAEGNTAPSPDAGMSIERNVGNDTDNNAADFVVRAAPTPKQGSTGTQGSTDGPISPLPSIASSTSFSSLIITFNELFQNPIGSDEENEWIELINLGDQEVNLTDWAVEDASGKHYTISQGAVIASTTIAPKGYFLLPRTATGIALNNTGTETLTLLSPSEQTIISVTYTGPAEEGHSWARDQNGNYQWTTTPTPSASNIITAPQIQEITKSRKQENNASQTGNSQSQQTPIVSSPPLITFTLVINELLPNPQGDDAVGEWIELKNEGDDEVTLSGLTLSDESGVAYTFTMQSNPIPPNGFRLLPRSQTNIVLNNDGDTLSLKYQGKAVAIVSYGKSEEGMSFARDEEGNFAWTTLPTPDMPNSFTLSSEGEEREEEEEDESISSVAASEGKQTVEVPATSKPSVPSASSIKGIRTAAIDAIRQLPHNTNTFIEGVVIVPPGVFGKTTFYLDGIQVYSVAVSFPAFAFGDRVQVQGYVSASGNETRITVPKTGFVKKVGEGKMPDPQSVTAESLGEEYEGKFVQVEGELIEKKGTTLWLDDGTGEVRVVIKEGTGLTVQEFTVGDRYIVIGVLSETVSGYRILPRGKDDIAPMGEVKGASLAPSPSPREGSHPVYYIITALTVMAVAGGLGWKKWKERNTFPQPRS